MLFIYNLPKITHLQEKFFVGKLAASLLYAERIKTRIVQAVGRCTRNAGDYSVVCILGDSILNEITSEKIQSTYHPEMRAEISFGINNSTDFKNVEDILENVRLFYRRGEEWGAAEAEIVDLRNQFISEGNNNVTEEIYKKLFDAAQIEVDFQYALWKKSYQTAYEKAIQIVETLNAPSLSGYKCYWQYVCGCLALAIDDKVQATYYFTQASNNNCGGIRWFSDLIKAIAVNTETELEKDYFFDVIESLEKNICKYQNNGRFETHARSILDGLLSTDGHKFEKAHLDLGILLGYDAYNPSDTAAPDPYWIINDDLCIVAEDKIYEDDSKRIPVDDVRQASGHFAWIRENVRTLHKNAQIITILVSNSTIIDDAARTFGKGIYYVQRKELCEWATNAINSLRSVRSSFQESGDANWRIKARELFIANQSTPKAFVDFITRKELSDM